MENSSALPSPRSLPPPSPSPPPPQHSVREAMGANIVDEIDWGNFFDKFGDFIDFPLDDDEVGGGGKLVPSEDIMQLEWPSTLDEDSFSSVGGLTIRKNDAKKESLITHNPSLTKRNPLSVLENTTSSSSSGGKTMPPLGPQQARSKRPRPTTFNPRPAVKLLSPSSSETTPNPFLGFSSEPDGFSECKTKNKKKKWEFAAEPPADGGPARKCMHCQVTKTPQWRRGPLGPKTLCNACGVRFNSGRLFPEYRPAASQPFTVEPPADGGPIRKCFHCQITKTPQWRGGPRGLKTLCNACGVRFNSGRLFPEYRPTASPTFVPFLHSNSHMKVVEMRRKFGPGEAGVEQINIGDPEVVDA